MYQNQHFQRGDRVRTTRRAAGMGAGCVGTVQQVFPVGPFCDVVFDERPFLRIVHQGALESVELSGLSPEQTQDQGTTHARNRQSFGAL
jgi:hypothetical protein